MAQTVLVHFQEGFPLPPSLDHRPLPKGRKIARVARDALRSIAFDHAPQAQHAWIRQLAQAVVSPRGDAWRQAASEMLAAGCSASDLIDIYIPAVARGLGADWVSDDRGFAQVTLGCTRLRVLLTWADARLDDYELDPMMAHGRVCLIAPEGGQHPLGQQVFLAQLLRHGVAAQIVTDPGRVRDADVVMISASGQEETATLRATVRAARAMGPDVRVLLGGGAVELARVRCDSAGADLVTNDLDVAISTCRTQSQTLRRLP